MLDWCVGIYCANEEKTIVTCLQSVVRDIGDARAAICVIFNGTTDRSAELAQQFAANCPVPIQIYRIAHGDKSNAINQFFHSIRPPARYYFGVDAHCVVAPGALLPLAECLDSTPTAIAATGIAGNGQTMRAETLRAVNHGGRFNGPLYAIRAEFIDAMRAQGVALPVDLYRGDGLLGSMLAHNLDALGTEWTNGNCISVPQSIFYIRRLSPLRPADVLRQYRRKLRQMRGAIENQAVKAIIYTRGYGALPAHADDLIKNYVAEFGLPPFGEPPLSQYDRPFMAIALRRLRRNHHPAPATLEARLLFANQAAELV